MLAGLVASLSAGAAAELPAPRIVAVGDIHGDLQGFTAILRQAGIVDGAGHWAAGRTILVQTGDFLDRGPAPRAVMDLLIDLEKEAAKAGGAVHVLLGNHEVMNLMGDLRYVTAANFADYAGEHSAAKLEAAWAAHVEVQTLRARRRGEPRPEYSAPEKAAWIGSHPAGFVEHREACAPHGKYGRWLRERPAALRIGETIFVHGGISDALPPDPLPALEKRVRDEIARFDHAWQILVDRKVVAAATTLQEARHLVRDEIAARAAGPTTERHPDADRDLTQALRAIDSVDSWDAVRSDGPLWFRGYAKWPDAEGAPRLDAVLTRLGAARLVVGHTPTDERRIVSRFGGRVFLIDTGMLASEYEGGRGSALEIHGGHLEAIYPDGRAPILPRAPVLPPVPEPPQTSPTLPAPPSPGHGPSADAVFDPPSQAAPVASEAVPAPAAPPLLPPGRPWLDPDGKPLPFASDDEILEFLRTAAVVSMKDLGEGTTHPKKVVLESGGVRAHAIFRDVDIERRDTYIVGKGRERFFRDSYILECAAYELSRMLGLDTVPPVVPRTIDGTPGSLQIWLEGGLTETKRRERGIGPPEAGAFGRQMETIHLFDALVYNTDRNLGNYLIDRDWKIWMIDHTRAFRRQRDLQKPVGFNRCDRALLARLRRIDPESARRRLAPFLRDFEIEALLARREKVLKHADRLLELLGESSVLFDFLEPAPTGVAAPS